MQVNGNTNQPVGVYGSYPMSYTQQDHYANGTPELSGSNNFTQPSGGYGSDPTMHPPHNHTHNPNGADGFGNGSNTSYPVGGYQPYPPMHDPYSHNGNGPSDKPDTTTKPTEKDRGCWAQLGAAIGCGLISGFFSAFGGAIWTATKTSADAICGCVKCDCCDTS